MQLLVIVAACIAALVLLGGSAQLVAAGVLGFAVAIGLVGWEIGGDAHLLPWLWGVVGERQTETVLDQLGDEWVCVHDVPRRRGNWDHIVVGPSGVFVFDSKNYARRAAVSDDVLRSGWIRIPGGVFRGSAIEFRKALAARGLRPPYVHAVVVVWGEFPQRQCEENQVTYISGSELLAWLQTRAPELTSDRVDAVGDAVRQLAASPDSGAVRPALQQQTEPT